MSGGERRGFALFIAAVTFAIFGQVVAAYALRKIDQIDLYDFDIRDKDGNLAITLLGFVLAAQFGAVLLDVIRSKAANGRMFFSVLIIMAALTQFAYWGFSLQCALYGDCM